jgi:hypothetical protein
LDDVVGVAGHQGDIDRASLAANGGAFASIKQGLEAVVSATGI